MTQKTKIKNESSDPKAPVVTSSSESANRAENSPLEPAITNPKVSMEDPAKLKPHPLNIAVYGEEENDDAFVASVKTNGIFAPLVVTQDFSVVSGHRRLKAALELKMAQVPVITITETDVTLIEKLLLDANGQREKTHEQRTREFLKRKDIEEVLAARRMTHKEEPRKNDSQTKKGKAADLAASEVGWTGVTAEKAAKVVARIDSLKEAGRVEESQELRKVLNEKSVSAAVKKGEEFKVIEREEPKGEKPKKKKGASTPQFSNTLKHSKAIVSFLESDDAIEMTEDERDELLKQILNARELIKKF